MKPYMINLNKYKFCEDDVYFQFNIGKIAFGLAKDVKK